MASSAGFDDIDRRILGLLQQNGRISNAELARAIHLSPAATFERVRRLQDNGTILGYAARLDPGRVQRGLLAFVQVTLDRTSDDAFARFAEAARAAPDILECHMVAGGFDYLLKVRVRDMRHYRRFLGQVLVAMPGIRQTHTYIAMESVKNSDVLVA